MEANVHPSLHFQAQIRYWEGKVRQATESRRRAYCEERARECAQEDAEFQKVRDAFKETGLGLVLKAWKNRGVLIRDHERPTFFRFQVINETGLVAHFIGRTAEAVLLEAFKAGFHAVDNSDSLRRMSRSPSWDPHQISHALPSVAL